MSANGSTPYRLEMKGEPVILQADSAPELARKVAEYLASQAAEQAHSPWKPGERTLAEIEADLSRRIPDRLLATKKKGGQEITIFTWVTAQRFLSYFAPGWHGHATLTYSGERVGCVYELCVPTADAGLVCRAATGDDSEDDEDMSEQEQRARQYGSPTTRAEGQAFKRAAARFGFGLYLRDRRR